MAQRYDFWDDKWIPDWKDFQVHTARPPDCPITYVSELIDQRRMKWKETEVRALVSKEEADSILSIPFPTQEKQIFRYGTTILRAFIR